MKGVREAEHVLDGVGQRQAEPHSDGSNPGTGPRECAGCKGRDQEQCNDDDRADLAAGGEVVDSRDRKTNCEPDAEAEPGSGEDMC